MDEAADLVELARQTEQTRRTAQGFFEACNTHDMKRIMDFFHPDIVHHARLADYTKEGIAFVYELTLQAFPDLHWTIVEMIAEADRVATLIHYEGTHLGDYLGRSNTGKSVSFFSINVARVRDGKFIEHRGVLDEVHLLTQIDALPAPYLAQMS